MRVSRYYNSSSSISQSSPLRAAASSKPAAQPQQTSEDSSPAVNDINHDVFSALNEFMYLKGEDRTASYNSLNSKDKDKFLSVLNQLVDKGTVKKDSLSVDDTDNPDMIKQALSERKYNSPKSYDETGNSSILE